MINVCRQCGAYHADKQIDSVEPSAICPECGARHAFFRLPLLVISGASGAGKSSVCRLLAGRVQRAVLLDADILWRPEFDHPEDDYRNFFETWLRLCKNIGQSGRPVVLFNAGAGVPANLANCVELRYFSQVHTLALVCSDEILAARLQARPAWRGSADLGAIEGQQSFNRWFRENSGLESLDTSFLTEAESAAQVETWILAKLD